MANAARLVAVVALVAISDRHRQSTPASVLAIRDANLVDVRTGAIRPRSTVLVDGNRIVRVGPSTTVRIPNRARVVDARGKYLVPGLIDTHVHLFRPWIRNWPDTLASLGWIVASGVTTIRDAAAGGLESNYRALRSANDSGRIVIPRIRLSGFARAVMNSQRLTTADSAFVRFRALGLDQVKILNLSREEALQTIRAARAAGLAVYGHTWEDDDDTFLESTSFSMAAVRAGISGLTHNRYRMATDTFLQSSGPRLGRNSTPNEVLQIRLHAMKGWLTVDSLGLRALIDTMVVRRTWYEPTLGAGFPSICTARLDSVLLQRYIPYDTEDRLPGLTPAQADTVNRVCDAQRRFVRRFYEGGVAVVTGSDNEGFPPRGVSREMRLLAEAGIPPLGVLQAATLNAARALEMDQEIGTIDEGKLADLVLLEANPLADITNVQRVATVIANGRLVDRTRLLARTATNPPMVSYDDQLDRLDEKVRTLAFQHPDSVREFLVYTDGTMRDEDRAGLAPFHAPVSILSVEGPVVRVRMPALAARNTSRIRFVVRIALADDRQ
jgi:imidazolonepropionase-like amidohydrolase